MNFFLPKLVDALVDEDGRFTTFWRQYIHSLNAAFGRDRSIPIYADAPITIVGNATTPLGAAVQSIFELLTFGASQDDVVYFSSRLPNNYLPGSNLIPYVEWIPDGTDTNTLDLQFAYTATAPGVAWPTLVSDSITPAGPGTNDLLQRSLFAEIDGADLNKGDVLLGRFRRDGSSDSNTDDIHLAGLGLKYIIDGSGHEKAHP